MPVWFIYPETCGVRLEDMDSLFGDASTAIATPATMSPPPAMWPEAGSLIRTGSPVAPLDLRGRPAALGTGSAIPGLDIEPASANLADGKPQDQRPGEGGGIRGWLSSVVNRGNSPSGSSTGGGSYAPLGQRDE